MIKTITQPDIIIVRYSSIVETEEYSWLKRVLSDRLTLTHEEIHNMDSLTEDKKSFLIHSYVEWAQTIAEEWKSTSNESLPSNTKLVCELCGNPNCKLLFEIKNTITGVKLNVGSSCINKFKSISKSFEGYKDLNQLRRKRNIEFNQLNREGMLKNKIGDKSVTYQKWQVKTFDYVLPYEKEVNRNNLINNFITLHNDFINKGNINSDNTKLFKTLNQIREKINNIDISITLEQKAYNISDCFCPYYIEQWVKDAYTNNNTIINQIKNNNGKLDNYTIKYIYNDDYLNNFIDVINKQLIKTPIKISYIKDYKIHFKVRNYASDLYIPSKDFMAEFGHYIFDKKYTFDYKEILSIIKANINSDVTLSELIEIFNDLMIKNNYKIISKEIRYTDDIIQIKNYLVRIKEKQYASELTDLETILQNCLKFLFSNNASESSIKIHKKINRINIWKTLDELKEFKEI